MCKKAVIGRRRNLSCVDHVLLCSYGLLHLPFCSLQWVSPLQKGAVTWGLFLFPMQSQVTPSPWRRRTAEALKFSMLRVLLCINRNESSASVGDSPLQSFCLEACCDLVLMERCMLASAFLPTGLLQHRFAMK